MRGANFKIRSGNSHCLVSVGRTRCRRDSRDGRRRGRADRQSAVVCGDRIIGQPAKRVHQRRHDWIAARRAGRNGGAEVTGGDFVHSLQARDRPRERRVGLAIGARGVAGCDGQGRMRNRQAGVIGHAVVIHRVAGGENGGQEEGTRAQNRAGGRRVCEGSRHAGLGVELRVGQGGAVGDGRGVGPGDDRRLEQNHQRGRLADCSADHVGHGDGVSPRVGELDIGDGQHIALRAGDAPVVGQV